MKDDELKNGRFMTEEDIAAIPSAFTMPGRMAKSAAAFQKRLRQPQELTPEELARTRHQFRPTSRPKVGE